MRDCPYPPLASSQSSVGPSGPVFRSLRPEVSAPSHRGRGRGGRVSSDRAQLSVGRGQARVYALSRQDAQALNAIVTGMISVCSQEARTLFDSGSKVVEKTTKVANFVRV